MAYKILYESYVVSKQIPKLSKSIKSRIKQAIETKLALRPEIGKPLQSSLKGYRRLRVGDYRIVYRLLDDKEKTILIVAIAHRKDVYK